MTSQTRFVPFNRPAISERDHQYIHDAIGRPLAGNGAFTARCQRWLEQRIGCRRALLTHSCTGALEMAAIVANVGPGDEVILPSFTFVSTANAFVLRGAVPVFVDIRPDTLNIDEDLVEAAVTSRTRAIVPVHYGGVGGDTARLAAIASSCGALVIEDAAQGILARRDGRPLGSTGQLAALSFHETKNVTCGEGGALLINDEGLAERAEVVWQKGTDRSRFLEGLVDKYTWQDIGSSYQPSEITAAFLLAQLEAAVELTRSRLATWEAYHRAFAPLEARGIARRPIVPGCCEHNAHLYYLLLAASSDRAAVLGELARRGVNAIFHYVPLHSSPAGRRFGRVAGPMHHTDDLSNRLIRLPLWANMPAEDVAYVTENVAAVLDAR